MSIQPPRDTEGKGLPGYLIVLAAFSFIVALFVAGVGLIAFGVITIGGKDEGPTVGVEGQALQSSGFTVRDTREMDGKIEVDVNVAVTNVSDDEVRNATMLVQCTDGGNVSNSVLIMSIDPDQTLQFEITLLGIGQPTCADPVVEFAVP